MKSYNFENAITKDMAQFLEWFCKNTTNKIFHRMDTLGIGESEGSSGALRKSIHAVIYNNAGGDDFLVRYYYLNYGRFIEMGLGHNRGSDNDLISREGKHRKVEGVKVRNAVVPQIRSWNDPPLDISFQGRTDSGIEVGAVGKDRHGNPVSRSVHHKAKPFLMHSIYAEMNRISYRMSERLAYHGVINLMHGLVGVFDDDGSKTAGDYVRLAQMLDRPWLMSQAWKESFTFNIDDHLKMSAQDNFKI